MKSQEQRALPQHLTSQISEGIHGLGYTRSFSSDENDYEVVEEKLVFENGQITKLLFETHRLIEHMRLQLILIITVLLIIDFDDQYFISELEDNSLLWLIFILNFLLLLFTYLSYNTKFNYLKATLLIHQHLPFYRGDCFAPFLIEFLSLIPIPTVFTSGKYFSNQDIRFNFTIYRIDNVFFFTVNDLLFLFTCFRSLNLLIILLRTSYIYNAPTHRISQYFGFRVKWSFTFKSLASEEPVLVISTIFLVQSVYLTIALWIVERPLIRDQNSDTLDLLKHSFYETVLALIRYAYEDYEPITVYGKIVLAFTQYSGFATTSLMIAAVARKFQHLPDEYNAYVLLQRMIEQHKMLQIGGKIGEQFYYLMKYPINPFSNRRTKLCLVYLKEFTKLKRNYYHTNSEPAEVLFHRKMGDFRHKIHEMQNICRSISEQQQEIHQTYHDQQQLFLL